MATAAPRVRDLLGLDVADPVEGEFSVDVNTEPDDVGDTGERRLQHGAVISAGGIAAIPRPDSDARVVATVEGTGGERETFLRGDTSSYCFDRTVQHEVRVFARQPGESYVRVKEEKTPTGMHRCLTITGLQDADVTLYPYPENLADGSLSVILTGQYDAQGEPTPAEPDGPLVPRGVAYEADLDRGAVLLRNVSDTITVNW